jgi:hypothetical protein
LALDPRGEALEVIEGIEEIEGMEEFSFLVRLLREYRKFVNS